MEWISVKDRLPEKAKRVQVASRKLKRARAFVEIASWHKSWSGEKTWYDESVGCMDPQPTHWMPLPEPPKQ